MKRKIIIEETVVQEFVIEINDSEDILEQIKTMCRHGKLAIEDPSIVGAQFTILDEDGEDTEWYSLL